MDISKLALAGLLGGSIALAVGCDDSATEEAPATEAATPAEAPPPPAAKPPMAGKHNKHGKMGDMGKMDGAKSGDEVVYSEVHDCAGKNSCKGIGGCAIDAKKQAKMGVDDSALHDCAGMNSCKGLGGCAVDEAKLTELKAKMEKAG